MKKNLISIIILALLLVNTIMTGVMMFTVIPANKKTMQLVGDISSAIQLDLGIAATGNVASATSNVAIADIAPYNIAEEMTIRLRQDPSGDGKDHFAVVAVTLSLNTKDSDYKTINEGSLVAQEGLIKDRINQVVGNYTFSEATTVNTEEIQQRILASLQEMYNSKAIVGVSFSKWLLQ